MTAKSMIPKGRFNTHRIHGGLFGTVTEVDLVLTDGGGVERHLGNLFCRALTWGSLAVDTPGASMQRGSHGCQHGELLVYMRSDGGRLGCSLTSGSSGGLLGHRSSDWYREGVLVKMRKTE
jgi:hypothetical protein